MILLAVLIYGGNYAHGEPESKRQVLLSPMALIPEGAFLMGSYQGPADERPEHLIMLNRFQMDIFPVTNAQFAQFLQQKGLFNTEKEKYYDDDDQDAHIFLKNHTWLPDPAYESHPVNEVSWVGARDFCTWASKRLPTEAEWEKAARGTDGRTYPWGNQTPHPTLAHFQARFNQTMPVDAHPKGASIYSIQDLAGNNWEWTSSIYQSYPYDAKDGRENPKAGPVRATRGGGHDSPTRELTTTQRGRTLSRNPIAGHHNIGFRCAKD